MYWKHLTENDVVVDVGGNVGTVTMLLVKAFPKPRYIIQDIAKVIEDGKNVSILFPHLKFKQDNNVAISVLERQVPRSARRWTGEIAR